MTLSDLPIKVFIKVPPRRLTQPVFLPDLYFFC